MLISPTTYQGGKHRIAGQILDVINPQGEDFYDLCCGSGNISIELINRGYDPTKIHMLDCGPWGLFWKLVGEGRFDLHKFQQICKDIPAEATEIQGYIKELSKQPADIDTPYVYLLLQAASFGGKSIWIKDNKWQNCSFRSYWTPTATSNRRSHVNPMMPMPPTLLQRATAICEKMTGVHGYYQNIEDFQPGKGIVYIDPPYSNLTAYGNTFDVLTYAQKFNCYVSEAQPLTSKFVVVSEGRKKGGISGERTSIAAEILNIFDGIQNLA